MHQDQIDKIELELFLEAIRKRHDYDFSCYAESTLKRRIRDLARKLNLDHIWELIPLILNNESFLKDIVSCLSIQVSEMFRDPHVFHSLRENVLPSLKSFPHINIWVAGCSGGEEAYSIAILLKEEGLFDKAQIFATDIDEAAIKRAKSGIFSAESMEQNNVNYIEAGGKGKLNDYFKIVDGQSVIDEYYKKIICFSAHNLASDSVFCETHLILCRNVLIYFNKPLKNRVLNLFRESLTLGGYLCLGTSESIEFLDVADDFDVISKTEMIYRKKYQLRKTG